MSAKSDKDLLAAIEGVFIKVMNDEKSTSKEKVDAAKEATKLLMIKHKITDTGDEKGSFFTNK